MKMISFGPIWQALIVQTVKEGLSRINLPLSSLSDDPQNIFQAHPIETSWF